MRSPRRSAALLVAFALALGCKSKGERGASEDRAEIAGGDAAVVYDAGPRPTAERAAEVVREFARALDGEDVERIRDSLRVPDDLSDEDVEGFLTQLASEGHLTDEGLEKVVELEFGPAAERFGDAASAVAANAAIPLDAAYAFGDASASVVLYWNGQRFQVVAVLNLASLTDGGQP